MREVKMDITVALPGECISHIISLTTPRDACRLAVVSPVFKSLAALDSVWDKFIPSDYLDIIPNSVSASSMITSLSKKDLYLHLCHNPIVINNGTMSFALEKKSGKKCYMVGARGLYISWMNKHQHWTLLNSHPGSRFPEVAELRYFWWFDIKAKVETRILSLRTNYAAYLIFKFVGRKRGLDTRSIEIGIYIEGSDDGERQDLLLDPPTNMARQSQHRRNEWMEIEMGEFFNENGDDGILVCSLFDSDGFGTKRGLIVQGIELRPKTG